MNITENFTLAELTSSEYAIRHGISNIPTDQEVLENLHILANGLERIRAKIGSPIVITSGYRCPKVNSSVGGSANSAHVKGLAADFTIPGMTPRQVCIGIADIIEDIGLDQLILEFDSWVHVSFPDVDSPARKQILQAVKNKGKTVYLSGLWNETK